MKLKPSKSFLTILLLFLTSRTLLVIATLISPWILPFNKSFPYINDVLEGSKLSQYIWQFANFDGVHYLRIARDGYEHQFTQAFFPMYPLIIKLASPIFLNHRLITGLVISNLAFLLSIHVFYKLIFRKYGNETALWSIAFLCFFPTSYYFSALYTESLFFLLLISSFYFVEKKKYLLANIIGAFASATRLVGVYLSLSLTRKKNLYSLIIIPLGLLLYMLYLKLKFGDPFLFFSSQGAFGQGRSSEIIFLPQVFFRYIKLLIYSKGFSLISASLELSSTILVIFLLIKAYFQKMDKSWLLFSAISVFTPTLTGTLTSIPRYILVAFPIYIVLASITNYKIRVYLMFLFSFLLFGLTILFLRGYWIA